MDDRLRLKAISGFLLLLGVVSAGVTLSVSSFLGSIAPVALVELLSPLTRQLQTVLFSMSFSFAAVGILLLLLIEYGLSNGGGGR